MFLSLHLPSLPLESLLRRQPEKRLLPCAVVSPLKTKSHSAPLLSCNRRAASFNLSPGLSITRALARCPDLLVLSRDPEAEAEALRDLLQLAESLTPDFELTTLDTLTLDLSLRSQIPQSPLHSQLPALGLPAQLATGPTPDLAHLASLSASTSHTLLFRGAHYRWKAPHFPSSKINQLPLSLLSHLKLGDWNQELLQLWGLQTLGHLADLPRQGLSERLGPSSAQLHDLLHAKNPRLLRLFKPIQTIDLIVNFEHPIDRSESLIFIAKRTLQTLCSRLHSNYRSASEIHLQLDLESQPPHHHRIRLPEPSASPEILLQPLATHLEQLQLPGSVTSLHLTLTPCAAHAGQHQLFGQSIRHPHRLADTLVRLSALLGDSNIGLPSPHFTHRPDSFHLLPSHQIFQGQAASPQAQPTASPSPKPDQPPLGSPHPLSRFRPPLEVAVAFEKSRPHPKPLALLTGPHRARISHFHGPFPLSGHWWDPGESWQQLEWDIELETHQLLRLSHTPPDLWQLQGSYS